jgi:hypothetical protein
MAQEMLEAAGFREIAMHIQEGDLQSVFFISKPGR